MSLQRTIDIPKNEPFVIVGYYVTSEGDLMGCKRYLNLEKHTSLQLEFEKVTTSEIKKWLYQE